MKNKKAGPERTPQACHAFTLFRRVPRRANDAPRPAAGWTYSTHYFIAHPPHSVKQRCARGCRWAWARARAAGALRQQESAIQLRPSWLPCVHRQAQGTMEGCSLRAGTISSPRWRAGKVLVIHHSLPVAWPWSLLPTCRMGLCRWLPGACLKHILHAKAAEPRSACRPRCSMAARQGPAAGFRPPWCPCGWWRLLWRRRNGRP